MGNRSHEQNYWVPVNKDLLTETVPANKKLLTGTVPVNNELLTGRVPVNYLILFLKSTQNGLLKNVRNGTSRPLGSQEIQKTNVDIVFGTPSMNCFFVLN